MSDSFPTLPLWRGFNLTELMNYAPVSRYSEADFAWTAEWGFNFLRLPVSFLNWGSAADWTAIDGAGMAAIDEALRFGERYGIHIHLALHGAPGYSVNKRESEVLFAGAPAQRDAAAAALKHHWGFLARLYQDIPAERLSFGLLNEPPKSADPVFYAGLCRELVAAIRQVTTDRLVFVDGLDLAQLPVPGLEDEDGVVQSVHCYQPKAVTHFRATWVPADEYEADGEPSWPLIDRDGKIWDRERQKRITIDPWLPLVEQQRPVHASEWGVFCMTPHHIALAWMRDQLEFWKQLGWGWSLWQLRGTFGVLDSQRPDVSYETFHGHQLDRRMLELLRER